MVIRDCVPLWRRLNQQQPSFLSCVSRAVFPTHTTHRRHLSWMKHSPPYNISLRKCTSPTLWAPCDPIQPSSCPVEDFLAAAYLGPQHNISQRPLKKFWADSAARDKQGVTELYGSKEKNLSLPLHPTSVVPYPRKPTSPILPTS